MPVPVSVDEAVAVVVVDVVFPARLTKAMVRLPGAADAPETWTYRKEPVRTMLPFQSTFRVTSYGLRLVVEVGSTAGLISCTLPGTVSIMRWKTPAHWDSK